MSQTRSDAHDDAARLNHLHASIGHYARMLWDIQKTRIAVSNRIDAMERDHVLGEHADIPQTSATELAQLERQIDRQLERMAKTHPMADWVEATIGLGYPGFARIIAVTGSLDRFPNVAKLWKYLGLHTVEGLAPTRRRGETWTHTNCRGGHQAKCKPGCKTDHHPNCTPDGIGTAYSPQGRVVCHQIGEAIVKVGRGPYRAAYDAKKMYYEANRPDWPQIRRHRAAMRYAVKELIKDMWLEWHQNLIEAQVVPVAV